MSSWQLRDKGYTVQVYIGLDMGASAHERYLGAAAPRSQGNDKFNLLNDYYYYGPHRKWPEDSETI